MGDIWGRCDCFFLLPRNKRLGRSGHLAPRRCRDTGAVDSAPRRRGAISLVVARTEFDNNSRRIAHADHTDSRSRAQHLSHWGPREMRNADATLVAARLNGCTDVRKFLVGDSAPMRTRRYADFERPIPNQWEGGSRRNNATPVHFPDYRSAGERRSYRIS